MDEVSFRVDLEAHTIDQASIKVNETLKDITPVEQEAKDAMRIADYIR